MDMAGTQILHIKGKVSDTIRHDTSPILKYPGITDNQWMGAVEGGL